MDLILTRMSKYFGFGDDDDQVVLDGGRVVGRIMLHPQGPPDQPWLWTITAPEVKPSGDNRGYCATPEEAMAAFKARWIATT
jgi:hypothetical protein